MDRPNAPSDELQQIAEMIKGHGWEVSIATDAMSSMLSAKRPSPAWGPGAQSLRCEFRQDESGAWNPYEAVVSVMDWVPTADLQTVPGIRVADVDCNDLVRLAALNASALQDWIEQNGRPL